MWKEQEQQSASELVEPGIKTTYNVKGLACLSCQNPPIPSLDTSVAARMSGAHGTMVCNGTGVSLVAVAKWSLSCRTSFTNFVNVICLQYGFVKVCWRMKKRWEPPYRAGVKLCNIPSNWHHLLMEVLRWCRSFWTVSNMVIKRCDGNARVIQWVSMSHPKIFFLEKTASPLPSFWFWNYWFTWGINGSVKNTVNSFQNRV